MAALLKSYIHEYFAGEKREMILIMFTFVGIASYSFFLLHQARTGFMIAFAATIAIGGGISSAGAVSLMARDRSISTSLEGSFGSGDPTNALIHERARVKAVIARYPIYRRGAAVLSAAALLILFLSSLGWSHGIAAAVLLLVAGQTLVDHFSEQRASLYFTRISARLSAFQAA